MNNHVLRILVGLLAAIAPASAVAQDPGSAAPPPGAAAPAAEPAEESTDDTGEAADEEAPAPGTVAPAPEVAPKAKAKAAAVEEEAKTPGEPGAFVNPIDTVNSDNLRLHTVQRKQYPDGGSSEVVLYPAVMQINRKFTAHFGSAVQYAYHLHENFAFQVMGEYFFINEQTGFSDELINKAKQAAQAATALTMQWAATGGFEVTPIYGKFAFFDDKMAHFGLVLTGGIGVGGSRIQIQGETSQDGSTFGDTGIKFVGEVGAGFRVRLTERFLVRLEVKDLVYTAKVDSINGCDKDDLGALNGTVGAPPDPKPACKSGDFKGGQGDYAVAEELVASPSSDVLNNLGFYGGVAYSF